MGKYEKKWSVENQEMEDPKIKDELGEREIKRSTFGGGKRHYK